MLSQYENKIGANDKPPSDKLPFNFKRLPISELHVHAEGGTLDPQMIKLLAQKNKMAIPSDLFGPNNTLHFKEGDFLDFLKVYDVATSFILTQADIEEVIYRYLKRCHQEGAIYIELTCSPDRVKRSRKTYRMILPFLAQA